MSYKIITFYTRDTKYEEAAKRLVRDADRFGMDALAYGVEDTGEWVRNCSLKPTVIEHAMDAHDCDLVFLDATCRLTDNLNLFDDRLPADVMTQVVQPESLHPGMQAIIQRRHAWEYGGMWNSGVLYMKRSGAMRDFVRAWADYDAEHPWVWDQITLQTVFYDQGFDKHLKHAALPPSYWPNSDRIGCYSGFHTWWSKKVPRRFLLLGSAPNVVEWWGRHGERCVRNGFVICAMNNAWEVPGERMNVWYRPDDFKRNNPDHLPPAENWYYEQPDGWNTNPYWDRTVRLSFIDIASHILNAYGVSGRRLELYVAGSDFNYDGVRTHFYGNGGLDPMRYGDEPLNNALANLKAAYEKYGCRIINVSDQDKTRLPFDRVHFKEPVCAEV